MKGPGLPPPPPGAQPPEETSPWRPAPVSRRTALLAVSAAALVAANLFPLGGLLLFDWSPIAVLVLYWLESGVVGGYALLRIVGATGEDPRNPLAGTAGRALQKLLLTGFFVLHYGAFWIVHGILVRLVAGIDDGAGLAIATGSEILDDLSFGALGPGALVAGVDEALGIAVAALVVSHGVSLALNYVIGGEHRRATASAEMSAVYGRVLLLQVLVLAAFVLVLAFEAPLQMVVVLVLGKTALDLGLHRTEHRRRAASTPG